MKWCAMGRIFVEDAGFEIPGADTAAFFGCTWKKNEHAMISPNHG